MTPMPTNNTDSTLDWEKIYDDLFERPGDSEEKISFIKVLINSEVERFAESLEDRFYEIGYDSVKATIDHHLTRYKEGK